MVHAGLGRASDYLCRITGFLVGDRVECLCLVPDCLIKPGYQFPRNLLARRCSCDCY